MRVLKGRRREIQNTKLIECNGLKLRQNLYHPVYCLNHLQRCSLAFTFRSNLVLICGDLLFHYKDWHSPVFSSSVCLCATTIGGDSLDPLAVFDLSMNNDVSPSHPVYVKLGLSSETGHQKAIWPCNNRAGAENTAFLTSKARKYIVSFFCSTQKPKTCSKLQIQLLTVFYLLCISLFSFFITSKSLSWQYELCGSEYLKKVIFLKVTLNGMRSIYHLVMTQKPQMLFARPFMLWSRTYCICSVSTQHHSIRQPRIYSAGGYLQTSVSEMGSGIVWSGMVTLALHNSVPAQLQFQYLKCTGIRL